MITDCVRTVPTENDLIFIYIPKLFLFKLWNLIQW